MAPQTHLLETTKLNSEIGPEHPEEVFRRPLARLDGTTRFSVVLSRLALNKPSEGKQRADPDDQHFIQAAGNADKMTLEIRKGVEGGGTQLFTIGHAYEEKRRAEPPTVVVQAGKNSAKVYEHELFESSEAADLFFHYYKNDDIPRGYALRELHFPEYENRDDKHIG